LGADHVPLVGGRTPIQMYADFVESFTANVLANATDVVTQVQIGQGPAGELRYPSYPLARWSFPGIGEFQMYDQHMLAALATYAASVGHPEWGNGGPDNAGTYNSQPGQTGFFADYANGNYASDYGKFFLRFYFESLLNHSTAVLSATTAALGAYRSQVMVSGKVAGIHWLYKTTSHAAECTAGYINTNGVDPYKEIAKVFAQFNALMDFTVRRRARGFPCFCVFFEPSHSRISFICIRMFFALATLAPPRSAWKCSTRSSRRAARARRSTWSRRSARPPTPPAPRSPARTRCRGLTRPRTTRSSRRRARTWATFAVFTICASAISCCSRTICRRLPALSIPCTICDGLILSLLNRGSIAKFVLANLFSSTYRVRAIDSFNRNELFVPMYFSFHE
jgi:hypothetical protein